MGAGPCHDRTEVQAESPACLPDLGGATPSALTGYGIQREARLGPSVHRDADKLARPGDDIQHRTLKPSPARRNLEGSKEKDMSNEQAQQIIEAVTKGNSDLRDRFIDLREQFVNLLEFVTRKLGQMDMRLGEMDAKLSERRVVIDGFTPRPAEKKMTGDVPEEGR